MAKTIDRRGRRERARTHTARTRQPALDAFYRHRLPPLEPGDFEFQLAALPGRGLPAISLSSLVESFEWTDESNDIVNGSLQLHRPGVNSSTVPVASSDRIRCRVRWGGRWYELWTMRADEPQHTAETGIAAVTVHDDMDLLDRTKRHYVFRSTKARPHGYFGHEITRLVCRRERVRIGLLAKTTHRIPKIVGRMTAFEAIRRAYQYETDKTGRRFIIRMRNGRLEVVPYQRNSILYVFADEVRSALTQRKLGSSDPATVLTGVGRVGKGREAKTIRHTEYRAAVVRRRGKVEQEKNYGKVSSRAELRHFVRRDLAKMYRIDRTTTVQVSGVPFLQRGDGCMIDLPSEGFSGDQAYVYVTGIRHQVDSGVFTTEFDVTTVDPFRADQLRLEKAARARARARRKKAKK